VEHGEVEAHVGELETEQILPIDAAAHGIRRLAVGQTFEELENRHHGETPGTLGHLSTGGEEVDEVLVGVESSEIIAHIHGQGACGEDRPRDAARLVRDGGASLRLVRHVPLLSFRCRCCTAPRTAQSLP